MRQVIRGECHDVFRTRQSSLDQDLPWLDDQWASGCRNGAELWRRTKPSADSVGQKDRAPHVRRPFQPAVCGSPTSEPRKPLAAIT